MIQVDEGEGEEEGSEVEVRGDRVRSEVDHLLREAEDFQGVHPGEVRLEAEEEVGQGEGKVARTNLTRRRNAIIRDYRTKEQEFRCERFAKAEREAVSRRLSDSLRLYEPSQRVEPRRVGTLAERRSLSRRGNETFPLSFRFFP